MSATRFSISEIRQLQARAVSFIARLDNLNTPPAELTALDPKELYYGWFCKEERDLLEHTDRVQKETDKRREEYPSAPKSCQFTYPVNPSSRRFVLMRAQLNRVSRVSTDDTPYTWWVNFEISFKNLSSTISGPYNGEPIIEEGHPYYEQLVLFAKQHYRVEEIKRNARSLFTQISECCSTPGQWNTVFPGVSALLGQDMQATVRRQKRKSNWPRDLPYSVKARIPGLTKLFASCALLPEYEKPIISVYNMRKE